MKLSASLFIVILSLSAVGANGEVRTMTLRQVINTAITQNPDVMLARLDQQKARNSATIQRDPFVPKVVAGSGLAYTYGFPTSIDGSAPSIVQVRVLMSIFNKPQNYLVAQANEGVRGAGADVARKQDEVVYRVATLYLDAEQLTRSLEAARRQSESLLRVRELMDQRVVEGRELPIEGKKANLAALRANQSIDALTFNLLNVETALALALGLGADDRVHPAPEERSPLTIPVSEDASIEQALQSSNELKSLQSGIQAKLLEVKSYQAARLPKINLIAQYALLGKYNNYEQFFNSFQRNNAEVGASIEIPILVGRAPSAQQSQTEAEIAKLRIQLDQTRSRITTDLRLAYQNLKRAESARDLARADLDLTREELNVALAQMDEGRVPLARVEALRATENEKFLALYDAQHAAELARMNVLRQTGTLEASLR
jgi:outer membrane protein